MGAGGRDEPLDQPESQYELADLLFHEGRVFDAEDSWYCAARGFARHSRSILHSYRRSRTWSILAVVGHDTASLRALSALYLSRNPQADDADFVRWRLVTGVGDTSGQAAISGPLWSITLPDTLGHRTYQPVRWNRARGCRASHRVPSKPSRDPRGAWGRAECALGCSPSNRGRPEAASRATAALRSYDTPVNPHRSLYYSVLDALYASGDTAAAALAVRKLAISAEARPVRPASARAFQLYDICVTQLWRLARGDTRTFERAIVQLRAGTSETNLAYTVQLCAELLDVDMICPE